MVDPAVVSVGDLLLLSVKFSVNYLCKRRIIDPNGDVGKKILGWAASDADEIIKHLKQVESKKFRVYKDMLIPLINKWNDNREKTVGSISVDQLRQELELMLIKTETKTQARQLLNSEDSNLNTLIDSVDTLIEIICLKSCTSSEEILAEIIKLLEEFMGKPIVAQVLKYHFTKIRTGFLRQTLRKRKQQQTDKDKMNIVSMLEAVGISVKEAYGFMYKPGAKLWESFLDALVTVRFCNITVEEASQIKAALTRELKIEDLSRTENANKQPNVALDPLSKEEAEFRHKLIHMIHHVIKSHALKSFDWAFRPSHNYYQFIFQQLALRECFANGEEIEIQATHNYAYLQLDKFQSQMIVVAGEPGNGKSTYVTKIADDWANGDPMLRNRFSYVFFIRCQEFSNTNKQNFGFQLRQLMMKSHHDYDLFPKIVDNIGTLIIFDGFDENPLPEIYELLKNRLIKLTEEETYYTLGTFMITTRPEHATIGLKNRNEFMPQGPTEGPTRPMPLNLIKISEKWIRVEGFTKDTMQKYLRIRLKDESDILEKIEEVDEKMIRNPLYATMLCALGNEKIQAILNVEYQFRKKIIFDSFDEHHKLHVQESKGISDREYRECIAEAKKLAIVCLKERYTYWGEQLPTYNDLNVDLLGKLCLTVRKNAQRYEFIHRTFAEYYAAVWLVENQKEEIFIVRDNIFRANNPYGEIIYFLIGCDSKLLSSYLKNSYNDIFLVPIDFHTVISGIKEYFGEKQDWLSIYDWTISCENFVKMLPVITNYGTISFHGCTIDGDPKSGHKLDKSKIEIFYFFDCQLNAMAFYTFFTAKNIQCISLNNTKINECSEMLSLFQKNSLPIFYVEIRGKYGAENISLIVDMIEKSGFKQIELQQRKEFRLWNFSINAVEWIRFIEATATTHDSFLNSSIKIENVDDIPSQTPINRIKYRIYSDRFHSNIIATTLLIKKLCLKELIIDDCSDRNNGIMERESAVLAWETLFKSPFDPNLAQSLESFKLQLRFNVYNKFNTLLLILKHSFTSELHFEVVIQIRSSKVKITSIPDYNPNPDWIDENAYKVLKDFLANRPAQFKLYDDGELLSKD